MFLLWLEDCLGGWVLKLCGWTSETINDRIFCLCSSESRDVVEVCILIVISLTVEVVIGGAIVVLVLVLVLNGAFSDLNKKVFKVLWSNCA